MENSSIIFKKSVIFVIIIFLLINSCLVIGVEHKTKDTCGNYSDLIFEKISNNWWNNSFSYRKLITVNHTQVDATLTNFPILVHTDNDSDLLSHAQIDGDDICFVLFSDNTTNLNHEIENYCNGTLWAWVNVTQLDANYNTNIWLYYGNSTCDSQEYIQGTWDLNFVLVQHLNEKNGTWFDSTIYENHGTKGDEPIYAISGKIDKAVSFDGVNDYIKVDSDSSLDMLNGNQINIEAWTFLTDSLESRQWITVRRQGPNINGFYGMMAEKSDNCQKVQLWLRNKSGANANFIGNQIIADSWCYLVGSIGRDEDEQRLYINGTIDSYITAPSGDIVDAGELIIGHLLGDASEYFRGIIDEVRISNIARNSSWISTSYNTMNNPESFLSFGNEQQSNNPPYVPSEPHPEDGSTNVNVYVDLSWTGGDPDGDNVTYDVYFGESSTPPKVSENQSATTYDPGILQVEKIYYWKIDAWDVEHGFCTNSPIWWFSTGNNQPPGKPVIFDGPDFALPDVILEFSTISIDPESDDIFYMWDWDDGSSLEWVGPFNSGQTVKEDHSWDEIGKFYVTVRVKDTNGAEGYLSDPQVLVVEATPPKIDFIKPVENSIYFWNEKVFSFFTTLIIGPIDIIADASDNISGIDRVEFYLNNIRKNIDYSIPYIWSWHGFAFYFRVKTLGIVAFDKAGNQASHNIIVGKFF